MANPQFPVLANAAADALSDALHALGTKYWKLNSTKDDTPSVFAQFITALKNTWDMLERFGGHCLTISGLNVGVTACNYMLASVEKSFAGSASFACTASATNYLYLDSAGTLQKSTSAWPAGDHFKIAKVVTNATDVTSITDARLMNFQIGIVNAWATVAASQDVDINDKALKKVRELWWTASTELTLSSDTITPTGVMHSVDTQADAATDDLVTITADSNKVGRLLILRAENAARVVTIKSTGNIVLKHGNLVMDAVDKFVLCMQHTATSWIAEPLNFESFGPLLQDLDCNSKALKAVGYLAIKQAVAAVLAADTLTISATTPVSANVVQAETGTADDLKTISGGPSGGLLLLTAAGGHTITLYDITAGGTNIILNKSGSTMQLASSSDWILLYNSTSTLWQEIARSKRTLTELVGTGQNIPYAIECHYPGALSANQNSYQRPVVKAFKLKRARGRVKTAPAGGSCVVDILKNGASIFASDAERINIPAGQLEDTSDTKDVDFAVNDYIEVKVLTPNSAADLTVAMDAFTEAAAVA